MPLRLPAATNGSNHTPNGHHEPIARHVHGVTGAASCHRKLHPKASRAPSLPTETITGVGFLAGATSNTTAALQQHQHRYGFWSLGSVGDFLADGKLMKELERMRDEFPSRGRDG
ncbi:hypothetical protein V8G54_006067 [Vigna mungo]|uniref:Uncharacterized protein n=1 Tax=Vigna mungo TaxID=3915 RepID=A0AAQ3P0G3_VIGMU